MRSLAFVLALGILGAPAAAAAADAPQPLSFTEAVAIALRQNPSYRVAATDVDAAQARMRVARGALGPTATLSDTYQVADPVAKLQTPIGALPFSPNATNVPVATLSYTLFDGGLTAARVAQADAQVAAARDAQREAATATIGRVATAYYDLAAASAGAGVADRGVTVDLDHVRLVQQRLDAGVAARAELLQVQTQLADARVKAIDAHNAVDRASNALDAALGVPLETRYQPNDPLDAPVAAPRLDVMLSAARTGRGELAAARAAIVAAQRALDAAKAARAPRVGVALSDGNVQPAVESGFHNQLTVALSAVWTVFDKGITAGNVAAAEAGVRRAALEVERLQTAVDLEIRQDYADVQAAQQRVEAARTLIDLAAENQRLAEIRYQGGVGTVLELRDAELQDTGARQTLVMAQAGLRRSLASLRVAAGLQ